MDNETILLTVWAAIGVVLLWRFYVHVKQMASCTIEVVGLLVIGVAITWAVRNLSRDLVDEFSRKGIDLIGQQVDKLPQLRDLAPESPASAYNAFSRFMAPPTEPASEEPVEPGFFEQVFQLAAKRLTPAPAPTPAPTGIDAVYDWALKAVKKQQ